LESAGGVFHNSFWQYRLPPNYHETRYWGNVFGDEILPFTSERDQREYVAEFNRDWDTVDAACSQHLMDRDMALLAQMKAYPQFFPTYNSAFTRARDKQLKSLTVRHIWNEPVYYCLTRFYNAIRLFVTAPIKSDIRQGTLTALVKGLYPFVITFCTFVLGGIVLLVGIVKKHIRPSEWRYPLVMVVYCWLIHVPIAAQSRYTVPVHLAFVMLIAVVLSGTQSRVSGVSDRKRPADC
jgi:hypothetical protein